MSLALLPLWRRLSPWPGGRWLFTRLVCLKAPYFASIRPCVQALQPDRCVATLTKRRAVHNHIRTVHAIAMCNLAELAAGMLAEAAMPPSHRWIPRGMRVDYLAKANTSLVATATFLTPPAFGAAEDVPVRVDLADRDGQVVCRATIDLRVSPYQKR